jgi:glycosyltransferase involved in cell wall biosynthesis
MITIFTPVHKENVFLRLAATSIAEQTYEGEVEWIILVNGDAKASWAKTIVPWARVITADPKDDGNIGALKWACCNYAKGDILVELDYDDQLLPTALEEIAAAFEDPQVQYVYSNSVEVRNDGSYLTYGKAFGWNHRVTEQGFEENVAFPAKAHYLRNIWWAPNHVRAYRTSAYKTLEYLPLEVGDDHDLCCRFYIKYGEKGFKHIDKCLYYYRLHGDNTSADNRNRDVQVQVEHNYVKYAEQMYLRWAKDEGLAAIDLGGRFNCPVGYKSVDLLDADIIADLEGPWPFEDDSIGVIRAYHLLEHLEDPIHFFNEAFRVLAPGGFLLLEVPSVKGDGAFADPTHKKFFNLLSFEYYTNEKQARFIRPQYTGRFQKARIVEYWWEDPKIPIIGAHLIALKGWYDERWCGIKEI